MPIEIIGGNCPEQNAYVADLYEKQHDKSLATALERSPKKKLVAMLQGMLLSRPELYLLWLCLLWLCLLWLCLLWLCLLWLCLLWLY